MTKALERTLRARASAEARVASCRAQLEGATELLAARNKHRAMRQEWSELNDKIRRLRRMRGLPPPRSAMVDFRVGITPATYQQKQDGPTYRDVADLLNRLGL